MPRSSIPWSLPSAQKAIIAAGCLGMAYTQLTMSPASIELARSFGANGLHIGLLGALPTAMLFMQFVAAIVANHLRYRRWIWFTVSVAQRLVMVPLACGPLLFPEASATFWIWALVLVTAANHAMLHFCTPLWLSWMGDYLPRSGLNRYWGIRHVWMQWCGALALLAGALVVREANLHIHSAFALLIVAGAVFGVADLLFFLKIDEPQVRPALDLNLREVFSTPFRHRGFRSFIGYSCFWHFAAMMGAPFINFFLLSHTGMSLFQLLLLWTFSWVGGAVFAGRLGRLAETFGNRPILILCTAFKGLNMIALLLVPADATIAFWVLVPVFMIDALLNAGIAIANNGFMLKNSPPENRTMYIAAGTALAGMVGGLTSIAAGAMLAFSNGWRLEIGGTAFVNFHALFAVSLVLRWCSLIFVRRVQEPESRSTFDVVTLLIGVTPLRILRFPLGLYRSGSNGSAPVSDVEKTSDVAIQPQSKTA